MQLKKFKKRTYIAGGMAAAAVGLASVGSIGLVSAATPVSTDGSADTSLVDKIATKFGLSKTDVQAVFDEDHSQHQAEMKAKAAERLAQAVSDGKLTQAQADHITQAMEEIQSLMGDKRPGELDQTTKDELKSKMEALRTWAQENNINMRAVGGGMMMGRGPGGPGHGSPDDLENSDDDTSSSSTQDQDDNSSSSSSTTN